MDLKTAALGLLIAASGAGQGQPQPWDGPWSFDGFPIRFDQGTYQRLDEEKQPIRIRNVVQSGDDFGLTLETGALMDLRDVTATGMTLETPGARFDGRRM